MEYLTIYEKGSTSLGCLFARPARVCCSRGNTRKNPSCCRGCNRSTSVECERTVTLSLNPRRLRPASGMVRGRLVEGEGFHGPSYPLHHPCLSLPGGTCGPSSK